MPVQTKTRAILAGAALLLAAGTIGIALTMPKEQKLGALVRFVTFHGASTWVNMMLFSVIGVLGLVYLVSSRDGVYRWEAGLRYVAMPLWLFNTVLGMISSKLAWGAVNWSEPRLQASFYILIGAAVVLVIDVVADRPKVSAAADLALAAGFWIVLLTAPNLMHPNNPVLNSGWDVKGRFFGMVGLWSGALVCMAALVRTWLAKRAAAQASDAGA